MKTIKSYRLLTLAIALALGLAVTLSCRKHSTTAAATDDITSLREEVAALREEIAQLRSTSGRNAAGEVVGEDVSGIIAANSSEVLKQLATLREQLTSSQRELASNLVQIAVDRGGDAWRRGDFKEALKLLKPLAEDGHPIAAHRLGVMYVLGQGVPKDSAEAIKYFFKAAEQGQGESQHSLGLRYLWGDGIEKNPETATAWFTAAANQGIPDSASWLGDNFWNGTGANKDVVEAYKWMILSGDKFSYYHRDGATLEHFAAQLTPQQKAEAEQRARAFVPSRTGPEDF